MFDSVLQLIHSDAFCSFLHLWYVVLIDLRGAGNQGCLECRVCRDKTLETHHQPQQQLFWIAAELLAMR